MHFELLHCDCCLLDGVTNDKRGFELTHLKDRRCAFVLHHIYADLDPHSTPVPARGGGGDDLVISSGLRLR